MPSRSRLADARLCYVCLLPIPPHAGIWQADLGILTHQGPCDLVVQLRRRTYDRSPRGRWLPAGKVLRTLEYERPTATEVVQ